MRVTLDAADVKQARALADATFEKFKNYPGHYRNTPNSHLKGKLGEIAIDKWLTKRGYVTDRPYLDENRGRECDLVCTNLRIEVNTWTADKWILGGRCVQPGQVAALKKKADVVAWCVALESGDACLVEIKGWNAVQAVCAAEIRDTGRHFGCSLLNHQLDEEALQPPNQLLARLRR